MKCFDDRLSVMSTTSLQGLSACSRTLEESQHIRYKPEVSGLPHRMVTMFFRLLSTGVMKVCYLNHSLNVLKRILKEQLRTTERRSCSVAVNVVKFWQEVCFSQQKENERFKPSACVNPKYTRNKNQNVRLHQIIKDKKGKLRV